MPVVFAKEYPAYFGGAQVTVGGGRWGRGGSGVGQLLALWRRAPRTATEVPAPGFGGPGDWVSFLDQHEQECYYTFVKGNGNMKLLLISQNTGNLLY